jgi:antitoxin component of MazEF toxin-antitoxin module
MKIKTNILKSGGSLVMRVPPILYRHFLKELDVGKEVEIEYIPDEDSFIVKVEPNDKIQ